MWGTHFIFTSLVISKESKDSLHGNLEQDFALMPPEMTRRKEQNYDNIKLRREARRERERKRERGDRQTDRFQTASR